MLAFKDILGIYAYERRRLGDEGAIVDIAENVLDDLAFDCAILDAFRIRGEGGKWCFDLSGSWGQVVVDTGGADDPHLLFERIRSAFEAKLEEGEGFGGRPGGAEMNKEGLIEKIKGDIASQGYARIQSAVVFALFSDEKQDQRTLPSSLESFAFSNGWRFGHPEATQSNEFIFFSR